MRTTSAVLVLLTTSAIAIPVGASAASAGHQQSRHGQVKCKDDGHKYIEGKSATVHGKKADFTGTFARFHPCGEDDGYFTRTHSITLTLTPKSDIKVFKDPLDPSATKHVTPVQFAHRFEKNMNEPIYQFSGPKSSVTKIKQHFIS